MIFPVNRVTINSWLRVIFNLTLLKAATEARNTHKTTLVAHIRVLARQIQAKPGVPDYIKARLGLNVPDPTPTPVNPILSKDLTADIAPPGLCNLKWNSNKNPQGTIFLLESSINPDTGWHIIGTTRKNHLRSSASRAGRT